jgi:hypothetical protein
MASVSTGVCMEQKRCDVCGELHDADLEECPDCAQRESEPEAAGVGETSGPTTPTHGRAPLSGAAIVNPSPRALAIRAWTDRVALGIIAFVVGLEVFAVLGFMVRAPISPITTLLAALASAGAVAVSLRHRSDWVWRTCVIVGICAVVLVATCALAGRFYDVSFDGQAYQGSAILRLAAGWNPLADVEGTTLTGPHTIWHAHFPKGPWLENAALFRLIGHIEPAKGLTLALACAAFAFCLGVFASFESMPVVLAAVFAFLAAFNPIVILQSFTFYIDARVSAWLTILIIALLDMALRADADWLTSTIVGLAAAAALNMKFTATGFVLVLLLGGAIIIFLRVDRQQFWKAAAIIGSATLVALLVLGWNPYVTNTLAHGSPLYPAMGRGARPIVNAVIIPGDFAEGGRLVHLYRSVFGVSDDPITPRTSQLKIPFTIQPSEWEQFGYADQRVGALGPLFGGAVLLAVATLMFLLLIGKWTSPLVKVTLQVLGLVAITVVMSPDAWWVRYNPQLWLIPLLMAAMPFLLPKNVVAQTMGALTCAVLMANAVFVGVASVRAQLYYTGKVKAELAQLSARKQPIPIYFELMGSNGERLRDAGISYTVLTERPADGVQLFHSDSVVAP